MTRFARGEVISGKYRIERTLSEGGASCVLLARHVDLGQPVAIKLLRAEAGARSLAAERFRIAARAAARLQGTHVCRVLDIDTQQDGAPLVVMEYLEGCHLAQELEQHGPLKLADAVRCVLEACDALGAAHAAGILHCDLKPANLFWATQPDGSRQIKLIGFGVPKSGLVGDAASAALSVTSSAVSSPAYMAPEQLDASQDIDERADVWALGAVLYELIAGRPAFQGDSLPALVSAVLNARVRPLSELNPNVPTQLDEVIARALQKRRDQRYATVTELVAALLPFAQLGRFDSLPDLDAVRSRESAAATSGERTYRGTGPREQQITGGGRSRYGVALAALLLLGIAGALAFRFLRPELQAASPKPTETALQGSVEPTVKPAPARPAGVVQPAPAPTEAAALPLGRSPEPVKLPVAHAPVVPTREVPAPRAAKAVAVKAEALPPTPAAVGGDISDFGGRR